MKASPRLIIAIASTLLEETAVALVLLLALPRAGIHVPVDALVAILLMWTGIAFLIYHIGSTALRKKPLSGFHSMAGCAGKAATALSPEGWVRAHGELWAARAMDENIDAGEKVDITGQRGLTLLVRRQKPSYRVPHSEPLH